jgi:hypothetical protein
MMEKLAVKTEALGENLPRNHFVTHKSHLPDPGANPGRRGVKPAINRFSYGAAIIDLDVFIYPFFLQWMSYCWHVGSRGNVSTESLQSNRYVSQNNFFFLFHKLECKRITA